MVDSQPTADRGFVAGPEFDAVQAGRTIAARFGITYEVMISRRAWKPLPDARRAFYAVLLAAGWNHSQIARLVGRTSWTILYACNPELAARKAARSKARWATRAA